MMNFIFSFKSNWYEDGVITDIGFDSFFLYLNMRKFELRQNKNAACVSIDLLFNEISKYPIYNGRKYTRPDIKNKILKLKKKKIINFDCRITNNSQLIFVEFLDNPNLNEK